MARGDGFTLDSPIGCFFASASYWFATSPGAEPLRREYFRLLEEAMNKPSPFYVAMASRMSK